MTAVSTYGRWEGLLRLTCPFQFFWLSEPATRDLVLPNIHQLLSLRRHHCVLSVTLSRLRMQANLLSVLTKPGEMQLTRAKPAHSTARHLVRCAAAAFDELYATWV